MYKLHKPIAQMDLSKQNYSFTDKATNNPQSLVDL